MPTTLTNASALVRVALTPRDLAIFQTLAQVRFLTAAALEWLHFPDRRPVWEADMQARMRRESRPAYRIGRAVYRRLQLLVSAGYLGRLVRPAAVQAQLWGGRDPDLFMLTELGALALADQHDDDRVPISAFRVRERSSLITQHTAEIGEVYAALQVKIASMAGLAMEGWQGDHETARSYDQIMVVRQRDRQMERVSLPVVPDGTFVLVHPQGRLRVFVEVDRGTRRIDTWREKIEAYHAYAGSSELRARYQTDTFVLLTIAPTAVQRRRLMQTTASVIGGASSRYLFALREAVHPLRIGTEWQKIGGITRATTTTGLYGQVSEKITVTALEHVFLQ